MADQDLKNHSRVVPLHHFVTYFLIVCAIGGSIYKLYRSYETGLGGLLTPVLFLGISIALFLTTYYARNFALKAQDRAIRAEESLRYFAMTGNLPDSKLTTQQFIALRFASNNELLELSHRAAAENLSAKEIKKAIKNWKADHYRV